PREHHSFPTRRSSDLVAGAVELLSVADMFAALGVSEPPPLLGWTFTDQTGRDKNAAITAFLDASFEAKAALLGDDGAWTGLQALDRKSTRLNSSHVKI